MAILWFGMKEPALRDFSLEGRAVDKFPVGQIVAWPSSFCAEASRVWSVPAKDRVAIGLSTRFSYRSAPDKVCCGYPKPIQILKGKTGMSVAPQLNIVPFVSVDSMMKLVLSVGIETFLKELADYIEDDFRRWEVFDKT